MKMVSKVNSGNSGWVFDAKPFVLRIREDGTIRNWGPSFDVTTSGYMRFIV